MAINAAYADRIYKAAREGTPVNPGLPKALAALVVSQAAHETGNFTSPIFKENNNIGGYTWKGSRYQVRPGRIADNGEPVGHYATIEDSVKEIVDWIYRRRAEGKFPADLSIIADPLSYAQLLKNSGYFTDALVNYVNGLKKWAFTPKVGFSLLGLLAAVGAGWYVYSNRKKLFN